MMQTSTADNILGPGYDKYRIYSGSRASFRYDGGDTRV